MENDEYKAMNREEQLPVLVKLKQRKLKALTEDYRLQRATLGQEISDINGLINKIRAEI